MLDVSNLKPKLYDEIEILNEKNSLKKYADYIGTSEYEVGTKFINIRAKTVIK